jgi:hypothetical protein
LWYSDYLHPLGINFVGIAGEFISRSATMAGNVRVNHVRKDCIELKRQPNLSYFQIKYIKVKPKKKKKKKNEEKRNKKKKKKKRGKYREEKKRRGN